MKSNGRITSENINTYLDCKLVPFNRHFINFHNVLLCFLFYDSICDILTRKSLTAGIG